MLCVHLENILLHAFHGIHEEEKILGNKYRVDCAVCFIEQDELATNISDTINYVSLYEIIRKHMMQPTPLLETVVMDIGTAIHKEFPLIKTIDLSLSKMHPPISGFTGEAKVSWKKEF